MNEGPVSTRLGLKGWPAVAASAPVDISPATDDRPYFKFLRRGWDTLEPDPERFVSPSNSEGP